MADNAHDSHGKLSPSSATSPRHHHGRIVSHAPGRVRVRLHREHRSAPALAQIERSLAAQPGVAAVSTNPRTGSVLMSFDHVAISKDDVLGMLFDAGVVARDLLDAEEVPRDLGEGSTEHSTTATGLIDALTDLDGRVARLTGGRFDVKLLVPLGMGLLAARQIATVGLGLGQVPGYVLLWYAFDSFYKLHQRREVTVPQAVAGDVVLTPAPG